MGVSFWDMLWFTFRLSAEGAELLGRHSIVHPRPQWRLQCNEMKILFFVMNDFRWANESQKNNTEDGQSRVRSETQGNTSVAPNN